MVDFNDEGIEFEGDLEQDTSSIRARYQQKRKRGMVDILVEHGIASSETQANSLLLGLIVVLFLTTFFVFFFAIKPKPLPPQEAFFDLTPPSAKNFSR